MFPAFILLKIVRVCVPTRHIRMFYVIQLDEQRLAGRVPFAAAKRSYKKKKKYKGDTPSN